MILQQQVLIGNANRVLIPEFVQRKYNAFSSTTFTVTADATPIEGNFMVITCGGGQNPRVPTFPGGFTVVDMSNGDTNFIGYKFAGAGESTNITVTWDVSLQGSLQYYEFTNIDPITPVKVGTGGPGTTFGPATSTVYPTYDPDAASVYIANLTFTNVLAWGIDNGFSILPTSSRFFTAHKIYSGPTNGEVTTWTGASGAGARSLIAFNGKNT